MGWGIEGIAKQSVLFYICIGPKPTVSNHAFEDLLGSQGFSSSSKSNEPKTIGSMRKQLLAEDMDPDKLKVCSYRLDFFVIDTETNTCRIY